MKPIQSKNVAPAIGPYSHAVMHGDMLYTSGQIPLTLNGEIVAEDVKAQTEQVMANIENILKEVEMTFENVIKTTIFIKDMNDFPHINEVYGKYFKGNLPSRSCVEVSRLPKDVRVEIEAIASK